MRVDTTFIPDLALYVLTKILFQNNIIILFVVWKYLMCKTLIWAKLGKSLTLTKGNMKLISIRQQTVLYLFGTLSSVWVEK